MTSFLKKSLTMAQDTLTRTVYGVEPLSSKASFLQCIDRDMQGNAIEMSSFLGSVLVVVNVASKWGLTDANYTQLTQLHDEYNNRGFKVLAFPCNQFAGQEPGTNEDIMAFAKKYGADEKFVFFEKADVNGKNSREVFRYLKKTLPNPDGTLDIRWNFATFLIDHTGNPVKRFDPTKEVYKNLQPEIEILLHKKEGK